MVENKKRYCYFVPGDGSRVDKYLYSKEAKDYIEEVNKTEYDFDSLEGIESIPVPPHKLPPPEGMLASPVDEIEYILQRKATQHKRNGRMDLAIACLRKSNQIMPNARFMYQLSDYMRLVSYLKKDGQFEEAEKVEKELHETMPELFETQTDRVNKATKNLLEMGQTVMGYDLIVWHGNFRPKCEECAKFRCDRVYSVSGKDTRFPPLYVIPPKECSCPTCFTTYVESFNKEQDDMYLKKAWNFIDERSTEEKELYERQQKQFREDERDRRNYARMLEMLPESAPKSYSGFRSMKNRRSKNYLVLLEKAKRIGIDLEEEV